MSVYGGGDALAAARQLTLEAEEISARGGFQVPDRQVFSRLLDSLAESARTMGGFDGGSSFASAAEPGHDLFAAAASAGCIGFASSKTAVGGCYLHHLIDLPPPVTA